MAAPQESKSDFGAYLRQVRERRGISLRQIATTTKISLSALEALERNDLARLPGGIFTRAFIRSYASEVGLDTEQTVREFLAQFPAEVSGIGPAPAESGEPEMFESEPGMSGTLLRLLLVSVPVAVLLIYFSLKGFGSRTEPAPALPPPPAVSEPTLPPPAQSPVSLAPETATSELSPVATANTASAPVPQPASTSEPLPASADSTAQLALAIEATGPCWVELQADGQTVFSRLMQTGDRHTAQARQELVLKAGDAGALSVMVNNRPGRPLGAGGQVVTARITRENYLSYIRPQP